MVDLPHGAVVKPAHLFLQPPFINGTDLLKQHD